MLSYQTLDKTKTDSWWLTIFILVIADKAYDNSDRKGTLQVKSTYLVKR